MDAEVEPEIEPKLKEEEAVEVENMRPVEEELKESYINYAMSVIVGRAIPDARDGLKPVHRRILYGMQDLGLHYNKPYKKCARIVGEVLGKYHPHGDSAVYDALVRMAQDFSMRCPLVNGQGNFGSLDGDNAAAMRYTEARLARIAEVILEDMDKDTVDYKDNFDATLQEPVVLPAKYPNLLVNGSSGIAVGMATNMAPHNLNEIVDATVALIDDPGQNVLDLMEIVQGPDFPTGGIVHGLGGMASAYKTGRGKVKVRGRAEIKSTKKKNRIIITEVPYQVNKASMLESMADLVKDKVLEGISDIRDESDRNGVRVVIELKRDAEPEVVLNNIYKHTNMETSFGIINLALVEGKPRVMSLKELMQVFIKHRFEVITRRTRYELDKAAKRYHIVEGLIIAVDNIDRAIELIRGSKDAKEARESLMSEFELSEIQAKAVLDMKLQKLTSMEIDALVEEKEALTRTIEDLKDILGKEERVYDIMKEELAEVKDIFGEERRTEIAEQDYAELDDEDLIPDEEVVITITHRGYIKRMAVDTYQSQGRGGKGLKGIKTKEEDYVVDIFVCSTHDYIMFFTNKGKAYWLKAYKVPSGSRQSTGRPIVNLLPRLEKGEEIQATIQVSEFSEDRYLFFATKRGYVKKTVLSSFSRPIITGIRAINLEEDEEDELINVSLTDGKREIILASSHGNAVRFKEEEVRSMGRTARGVRGMSLRYGDEVMSMTVASEELMLLTITENGYGKRTPLEEYRLTHRGGKGVITIRTGPRNGPVIRVVGVTKEDEIMMVSRNGMIIRETAADISTQGRATMGVRLMKLNPEDVVQSVIVIKE